MSYVMSLTSQKVSIDRGNIMQLVSALRENQNELGFLVKLSGGKGGYRSWSDLHESDMEDKDVDASDVYPLITDYAKYVVRYVKNPLKLSEKELEGIDLDYKMDCQSKWECGKLLEMFAFSSDILVKQREVVMWAKRKDLEEDLVKIGARTDLTADERTNLVNETNKKIEVISDDTGIPIYNPSTKPNKYYDTNAVEVTRDIVMFSYVISKFKGTAISNPYLDDNHIDGSLDRMRKNINDDEVKKNLTEEEYAIYYLTKKDREKDGGVTFA